MKKIQIFIALFISILVFSCQQSQNEVAPDRQQISNLRITVDPNEIDANSCVPSNFQRPIGSSLISNTCYPNSSGCSTWLTSSIIGSNSGNGKLIWTKSGSSILFTRPIGSFQPSSDLIDALTTNGNAGYCNVTKQAHHIIPWDSRNQPLVQIASNSGFHPNDYPNGVYLNRYSGCLPPTNQTPVATPTAPFHNGSHPAYTTYVNNLMANYKNNSSKYNTPIKAYELLYCGIIPYLKLKLQNAESASVNSWLQNNGALTLNSQYGSWTTLPLTISGWPL